MRRGLLLMALCAMPVGAMAQTWTIPTTDSYIIGNTLVTGTPVLLASGKGSPAPSRGGTTAPSSASQPSRGESGFTFQQPLRVQLEGPTVTPPLYTPPVEVTPLTVQLPSDGGEATLTIPVRLLFRQQSPAPDLSLRQRFCNAYGQCIQVP